MVPVVALIHAMAGKETALEKVLKGIVEPTRKEAGCVQYDLHRDLSDPRLFVFIEKWKSPEDLNVHLASSHLAAAMARKAELIESIAIHSLAAV